MIGNVGRAQIACDLYDCRETAMLPQLVTCALAVPCSFVPGSEIQGWYGWSKLVFREADVLCRIDLWVSGMRYWSKGHSGGAVRR